MSMSREMGGGGLAIRGRCRIAVKELVKALEQLKLSLVWMSAIDTRK